jgi:hypothetical protein
LYSSFPMQCSRKRKSCNINWPNSSVSFCIHKNISSLHNIIVCFYCVLFMFNITLLLPLIIPGRSDEGANCSVRGNNVHTHCPFMCIVQIITRSRDSTFPVCPCTLSIRWEYTDSLYIRPKKKISLVSSRNRTQ